MNFLYNKLPFVHSPPPAPVRNNNFAFPVYYGNSLTAEIATTRQGYLANGGSDPDVLQQLAQMQAEAQAIDDNLKNQRPAPRQRGRGDVIF